MNSDLNQKHLEYGTVPTLPCSKLWPLRLVQSINNNRLTVLKALKAKMHIKKLAWISNELISNYVTVPTLLS
jgi:hypothetical protein